MQPIARIVAGLVVAVALVAGAYVYVDEAAVVGALLAVAALGYAFGPTLVEGVQR